MADPGIFASGPARQVAQYLGAVYLAQAKKMQSALADASSAKSRGRRHGMHSPESALTLPLNY